VNVRKFIAPTSKEALRQVRDALGDDAVVLSSRAIPGGVEIIALTGPELDQLTGPKSASTPAGAATKAAPENSGKSISATPKTPIDPPVSVQFSSSFSTPNQSSPVASTRNTPKPALNPQVQKKSKVSAYSAPLDIDDESDDFGADLVFERPSVTPRSVSKSEQTLPSQPSVPNPLNAGNVLPRSPELPPSVEQKRPTKKRSFSERTAEPAATPLPSISPEIPATPLTDEYRMAEWIDPPSKGSSFSQTSPQDFSPASLSKPTAVAASASSRAEDESVLAQELRAELQTMRDLLQKQMSSNATAQASGRGMSGLQEGMAYTEILRVLLSAGFGGQLCKTLLDELPQALTVEQGMDWARQVLERNIPVIDNEDTFLDDGGVFALVGPTGVGKTTTTAKLAARAVMRFGPGQVALLSTDSFRIGAHEQLRIYGRILGIPVHALNAPEDFSDLLSELADKRVVLIDTVGMSQRDRTVPEQLAMLQHQEYQVKRLLLLNATSHGNTLNEVVRAYKGAAGQRDGLTGCIITKIDEATHLGGAIDCVIRHRLPVYYVSTGQRVPEHLYVARKSFLVRSALMLSPKNSPFVPEKDDFSTLLATVSGSNNDEVTLG
jgi:flagellar biosynthesis protein FlhF